MIRILILLLAALSLAAQSAGKPELVRLTDELNAAMESGDWASAVKLSSALKTSTEEARNRSMESTGREQVDSILEWFPADTETIIVAQQPFQIVTGQSGPPTALEMARAFVVGLSQGAEKGKLATELAGRTIRLAVYGARRFGQRSENQPITEQRGYLGMIPYQGCAVYLFAAPIPEPILSRPNEELIVGNRVWTSKGSQNDERDRDTYLVSMLQTDTILVCNSREFFQEIVARIGRTQQQRALPSDLPEWKLLDRSVPLWGITHYRNPTVIASLARGNENLGAIGLIVEFGLKDNRTLARMMAKADPWKEIVKSPDFRDAGKSGQTVDGVWELTITGQPASAYFAVLVLLGELGFLILI